MYKYSIIYIFEMFYLEGTRNFVFSPHYYDINFIRKYHQKWLIYNDSMYYNTLLCMFDIQKWFKYAQCITE